MNYPPPSATLRLKAVVEGVGWAQGVKQGEEQILELISLGFPTAFNAPRKKAARLSRAIPLVLTP